MNPKTLAKLVKNLEPTYSSSLGIDLKSKDGIFKWFLASILFGARISETIVKNTYRQFEKNNLLSPSRIYNAGWDKLVEVLDSGGYVRYDFKTADKLLEVTKNLIEEYDGNLEELHKRSTSPSDLEERLRKLGKGIGPITVSIFLRELRNLWSKADPEVSPLAKLASKNLQIDLNIDRRTKNFVKLESNLVRLGKDYCRKKKCPTCPVKEHCKRVRN